MSQARPRTLQSRHKAHAPGQDHRASSSPDPIQAPTGDTPREKGQLTEEGAARGWEKRDGAIRLNRVQHGRHVWRRLIGTPSPPTPFIIVRLLSVGVVHVHLSHLYLLVIVC
jgi:hypothetical protein